MAQPYSLLGSKIWLSLSESSISGSRLSTKNYNLSAGKPTPFYVYMYFAPYSVSSSSSRAWVEALPSSNQTAGIKELGISHGPSSTDHWGKVTSFYSEKLDLTQLKRQMSCLNVSIQKETLCIYLFALNVRGFYIIFDYWIEWGWGIGGKNAHVLKMANFHHFKSLGVSSEFEQNDEWHDNPLFIESQFVTCNILSSKQIDPNSSLMLTRKRSLMNLTYGFNKTKLFRFFLTLSWERVRSKS